MDMSVSDNVSMNAPLLSRFDLVFVLRDEANHDHDRMISGSIMGQLRRGGPDRGGGGTHPESGGVGRAGSLMDQFGKNVLIPLEHRLPWVTDFQKQPLPLQQVKDYIAYAREYCHPKLSGPAATVLKDHFMKLR
jgi:DNA helicase MCM8